MKKNILLAGTAVLLLFTTACNKTKKNAKLLSGETWAVSSITIDGTEASELAVLHFDDCVIYDELCSGNWINGDGHSNTADEGATFYWQIREKGKVFELSNQSEDEYAFNCSQYSGVYDIVNLDKTNMEIKSTATVGYSGKTVIIKMSQHTH
jgi:hypothetical protein